MDIDTYIARNEAAWLRLDELARRCAMRPESMGPEELGEFVALYGHVSTHLSYVRTHYSDDRLVGRVSGILARAGASLHGTRPPARGSVSRFFTTTLPAAVWHVRPFIAASAVLTFVPAILLGIWLSHSPHAVHTIAPPPLVRQYVNQDFGNYYHSEPALEFAAHVYINNVFVSLIAFVLGACLCLPGAYVLVNNGVNLGVAAGLLTYSGKGSRFWVLVLPHGMVELTSVVLAGAAGLRLGWTFVDPGDRPRSRALVEECRRAVVIVMGVAMSLGIAGIIEGTVTGSSLPPFVRVGIGALAEIAILTYLIVMGKQAHAQGYTGALGETLPPLRAAGGDTAGAAGQAGLATITHSATT